LQPLSIDGFVGGRLARLGGDALAINNENPACEWRASANSTANSYIIEIII
jgi:hypothetical protein